MDGDFPLERELNALLTAFFVGEKNLPSDECLAEARKVIELGTAEEIKAFLVAEFTVLARGGLDEKEAEDIHLLTQMIMDRKADALIGSS